jgi:molybdopterin/thiamine biosynthesis adenylyltransferase
MSVADADEFYEALADRTVKYRERPLDPQRRVAVLCQPEYLQRKSGQIAVIVTANLLCRMVRKLTLAFPDIELHSEFGGPMTGSLHRHLLDLMRRVAPFGEFGNESATSDDYPLSLGPSPTGWTAHGEGWSAYVGPSPSPIELQSDNVFGAGLAAVTAIARVFHGRFPARVEAAVGNVLSYSSKPSDELRYTPAGTELGNLWLVGLGSVGSSAAYFLALAGYRFRATLFDEDIVKVENLDRSPIFLFEHCGFPKVAAVGAFLRAFGLDVREEPHWLDRSEIWRARQAGEPDLIIAAANERNVRFQIETQFPPVQIYGTTGKDWQSNMFRHVPGADPCSSCAFPAQAPVTDCAVGTAPGPMGSNEDVDAALPFLSFAAGLMAAAEISKLQMDGFPFSGSRAFFTPLADEILYTRPMRHRPGCYCQSRDAEVHAQMLDGSKYAALARF